MDDIIARYRGTSNFSVISQSALESAKESALRQPHHVLLPLVPLKGHTALVLIAIQPLISSEWPGCVFFAVAIRELHCCCHDAGMLDAIGRQVGGTIGRVYPRITVDVLTTLRAAPVFQLPPW